MSSDNVVEVAALKITLENYRGEVKVITPAMIQEIPSDARLRMYPISAKLFGEMAFYSRQEQCIGPGLFIPNGPGTILLTKGEKLTIEVI